MKIKTKSTFEIMERDRDDLLEKYNKLIDECKTQTEEFNHLQKLILSLNKDIMEYIQTGGEF